MYKIPANTLFLGKQVVFVPECHSTNTLALEMAQKSSVSEGTVVITNNQTAGRGQRNNSWESHPGLNLTFSIVLRPGWLEPRNQFFLNIISSLAVRDAVSDIAKRSVSIKWPNDVLVENKKVCGILVENQVQGSRIVGSVIGIGLNVNQSQFQYNAASSLKAITGGEHPLENCLHRLLGCLEARYLELRHKKESSLKEEYLASLYWRNEPHKFGDATTEFEGTIAGVDDEGRLQVLMGGEQRVFGVKEIRFIS